jgi:cytidylate kinase
MSAMVIAIDGPAAAGKGTLGRKLAEHFGLAYLDTGALYRAVALRLLRAGGDPADAGAAAAAARALEPDDLEAPGLRDQETGRAASAVAAWPEVRAALVDYQRRFAAEPSGGAAGAVLEGRDIGTVVCPEADYKLFVTASLEVRAGRRLKELAERGEAASREEVEREMRERDARDSGREVSPLARAPDAYLLDTTNLDIDSAFAAAKSYIGARTP